MMTSKGVIALFTLVCLHWTRLLDRLLKLGGTCGGVLAHTRQPLHENVQCRDDEDSHTGCGQHSANDCGTHNLPADRTCTGSNEQRHATEDECERGHQNRPQP